MKRCPECRDEYDDEVKFCPRDGGKLEPATARLEAAAVDSDGLVGVTIDGKYKIIERIGRGGWGSVYRAKHIHFDRIDALKVLNRDWASDANALMRFQTEALASSRIKHPNVVEVRDFNLTSSVGQAYLAMEFLHGHDLRKRLEEIGQLDLEEATTVVLQACAGLEAAHAQKIIHRDLKPENIWLCETNDQSIHVKVLDFGIARINDDSNRHKTMAGMMVGTPSYMSPEQVQAKELDGRSDIYSLGIVLYEMITGEVPFSGSNPIAVAMKQSQEMPRPPRFLRPDIPERFEKVVLRSLEKSPAARPQSPSEFGEELERALYGRKTPTIEKPAVPRTGVLPSSPAGTLELQGANGKGTTGAQAYGVSDDVEQPNLSPYVPVAPTPEKSSAFGLKYKVIAALVVVLLVGGIILWVTKAPPVQPSSPTNPTETIPAGMLLIPGGTFMMGAKKPTAPTDANYPEQEVKVNSFLIDQYEVTNGQYRLCVDKGVCSPPTEWRGPDNYPVVNVTWDQANTYARYLTKRLPTEAEWEYAARGTTGNLYPWGNSWNPQNTVSKDDPGSVQRVGSRPGDQSVFKVMDLAGNVSEWVNDTLTRYKNGPEIPSEYATDKVIRGGSYSRSQTDCQVTKRFSSPATAPRPTVGFRCAKDAP